jgi:hypothetical protein
MAIGQDLLDIPFADLVRDLASAIAEGQLALDRSSIETLKFLMADENKIPIVPEIAEILEPASRNVDVGGNSVPITGVSIRASGAAPVMMTLLQAGLMPTFYQFTEANIEVKLSITMKRTESSETSSRPGMFGRSVLAFGAPVNFRTANTYSYTAQGSSTLRVTMRPVPPPSRLTPRLVTINAFTTPPTITSTQ